MLRLQYTLIILFFISTGFGQSKLSDIIERYEDLEKELSEDRTMPWPLETDEIISVRIEGYRTLLDELDKLDYASLDDNESINADMLKYILSDKLYLLQYGDWYMPLNAEGGFITGMIYSSRGWNLTDSSRTERYLDRLRNIPAYFQGRKSHMLEGLSMGRIHPKLVVNNCIQILDDIITQDLAFLYQPALDSGLSIDAELMDSIDNAFEDFRTFLSERYLPYARDEIGYSANKDGKAFYRQRVRYFTSLDMSPEEVYNIGIDEVEKIKAQMLEILQELEYGGSLDDFINMLRTDERFYAKTPEELLYYASWLSKKAEEFLPRYFGTLPRLPFTVKPVPENIAANYTTGRYSGGSMKTGKAGEYWVNTYDLKSRPLYMMTALTLHEAVPGHHLQGSLASELTDLPVFRKQYLSAFGEGWGLYSEYLGREAGMYETLYDLFGSLSYEMWRACRLVIDPGIHYMNWTRDEAIDFMTKHTSLTPHEIENEIDRYIGWPGQAVSYKIGEIKIRELRNKAENQLGEKFDIKSFHDTLLANGSVTLKTLERIIDDYINENIEDEQKN
ncbi:MAG: DUF885 domain-containing protein [Saprospiraceae bacterium]|jgi:uncharacterized protein (DUF885 family)